LEGGAGMNSFYAFHDSQDLKYRYPFGAVTSASKVTIIIEAEYCQEAVLKLIQYNGEESSVTMTKVGETYERHLYKAEILTEKTGLINYYFVFKRDGETFYYGNNEEMLGGLGKIYSDNPKPYQITVYKEVKVPAWYKEGIIYQIFVDRFCNGNPQGIISNPKKNSFIYGQWSDDPMYIKDSDGKVLRWDFFGGNLEGVIKKLPYIKSFGVTAIYLNPIFEAVSNHKYDAGDYKKIDPMFGDEEKFKELCRKAEELDMKIILDGVFSHTGADSVYFNKYGNYNSLGAYQSQESPYFNWYNFKEYPDKYDCWWGFEIQPNINELEESFTNYIIKDEDSVINKWMKAGAYGWRLDVADELPDEFISILKSRIKEINKDSVLIGEVWEDASNKVSYEVKRKYFFGDELDSVTNYPFRDTTIQFLKGNISSEQFKRRLMSLKENYPEENFFASMNLLGTHDTERILTMFGENDNAVKLLKLAVAIQMCLPGVPLIYYGDEAGLVGGRDPENRKTYPWGKENMLIQDWYKMLTGFRSRLSILKKGNIEFIPSKEDVLCFKRSIGNEVLYVLVNRGDKTIPVNIDISQGNYEELIDTVKVRISHEDSSNLELEPYGVKILVKDIPLHSLI
jgi:cyclomaltodextrinase / maltogenic alpha-amylase / neopullulanase